MQETTLQVSEAIELVNQTLDAAFGVLVIEGEVASFKVNQNKFVFFDIKDESGTLGCFMMLFSLKFPLEDGMRVRVLAQPKITQWGKFSLTIREVMPIGEGNLKKSFELLRAKLEAEGLFDSSRKRILPKIPKRIGVISSSKAAGYADFVKILGDRWGGLEIVLVDVPVQGIEAPAQIIGALRHLNELSDPLDVIAIIRGGGSADDLASFNHEGLVREICASRTPTIVGVGHETDTSLADLVADVRAATPSNAAQLLVPDKYEVLVRAERVRDMAYGGTMAAIRVFEEDALAAVESISDVLTRYFETTTERSEAMMRFIHQVNPATILRRGYALARQDGHILQKTESVIIGSGIEVQLSDGRIGAKVTYVDREK